MNSPLVSGFEMQGGSLVVTDLALQLEHVFFDPSDMDGTLPVVHVGKGAQVNVWGELRNKGTFKYLGSDPLVFNFFPKVGEE